MTSYNNYFFLIFALPQRRKKIFICSVCVLKFNMIAVHRIVRLCVQKHTADILEVTRCSFFKSKQRVIIYLKRNSSQKKINAKYEACSAVKTKTSDSHYRDEESNSHYRDEESISYYRDEESDSNFNFTINTPQYCSMRNGELSDSSPVSGYVSEVTDEISPENGKRKHISEMTNKGDVITAYDYVIKERQKFPIVSLFNKKWNAAPLKLDSKGFRILKNQVPDLSNCTQHEILNVVKNNILYSNDDFLVLNKPYNLVIHDAATNKNPSLSSILDNLARLLDPISENPKLLTVHRLDKETTGCLILARNELAAQYLKSMFAQHKIIKTYWILTIKVPENMEGIIEIPITEGLIDGKTRMVLQPEVPSGIDYKSHVKRGRKAITHYKVISTFGNAALIEVKPETGIKHQIRVHFGFGLNCPILGDHKYSHLTKLAPQKLPSDLLQKLHVRQSKVRHIPLHIHALSVQIPEVTNGKYIHVSAPLPEHMKRNLKTLKIKKRST